MNKNVTQLPPHYKDPHCRGKENLTGSSHRKSQLLFLLTFATTPCFCMIKVWVIECLDGFFWVLGRKGLCSFLPPVQHNLSMPTYNQSMQVFSRISERFPFWTCFWGDAEHKECNQTVVKTSDWCFIVNEVLIFISWKKEEKTIYYTEFVFLQCEQRVGFFAWVITFQWTLRNKCQK